MRNSHFMNVFLVATTTVNSLKYRPLALRGHLTNASSDAINRQSISKSSYSRNLRGNAFKGDILWHFEFSTKYCDVYWPPCLRAYSCPPTWRHGLLMAAKTTLCLYLVKHLIFTLRCAVNVTTSSFLDFPLSLSAKFVFRKR